MAINQQRYDHFRRELNALLVGLRFKTAYRTIEARIIDLLSRTDYDANDPELVRLLEQIFDGQFRPYVEKIVKTYGEAVELVDTLYADFDAPVTRDLPRLLAIEQTNLNELGRYSDIQKRSIAQAVRESILEGESSIGLKQRLEAVGGRVRNYAQTIAQTQVNTHARIAKAAKARLAGVYYYEYVGLRRDTNRPFCTVLIGSTHHEDVIARMRNGNREPVHENCGGWNCIHDWEPNPFATENDASPSDLFTLADGILVPARD